MAEIISRLKLESGEFDSKIKRATQGLLQMEQECRKAGKSMNDMDENNRKFVQSLGSMQTVSSSARGKIGELSAAFTDLRSQYNRLTDEEKKGDFGRAMSASLEQLKTRVAEAKAELKDIQEELDGGGNTRGGGFLSGIGNKMSGALQVFAGNMLTKAAGAVANLGSEMYGLVQQGIELARHGEGIRNAFERLGRGDVLDGLREATHGTVTDIELMKAAVKFNDFKLPLDELGTMLAFAQQKAKDTGQSVDYMVDSIVTGLGRKSLMILDNLGLSATEVKDRMAETGDMTKAVGAIIREQMSKAGDYVETAADRAAQANVSLQNKMEELGRKFAPVEEASSQLWTSMKIGILDIIGGPLATLLNQLTEAGRLKNMLNDMNGEPGSGNTKVDQQVKKLNVIKKAGGSDYIFNSTLNGMLEDYNRQIAALDAKIKDTKKLSPDQQASKFVRDEVQKMSEQMKAIGMMRDQLAAGAKELSKPIKQEITPTVTTSGGATGRNGGTAKTTSTQEVTYASDSIVAQQKLVQELTKKWNEAGADVREQYVKPLVEAEAKLREMQNAQALSKEQAQGKLLGNTPDGKAVEIPISSDIAFETWMAGVQEKLAGLKLEPIEIPIETAADNVKDIAKAASITADVVGSIGDAFNAIEDPAAKVAGTVMQAIASVALGYAQATTSAAKLGPWAWIAFAATGLATMISTISAIHSSTGYANGGVIKGNSYSGDNIGGMVDGGAGGFVGLNAGEVVLNAAQQNTLAQNLSGNLRSIHVVGKISGTDIILSADRTLMTQGKQLAVWGR